MSESGERIGEASVYEELELEERVITGTEVLMGLKNGCEKLAVRLGSYSINSWGVSTAGL